jgi:hypothetical protein
MYASYMHLPVFFARESSLVPVTIFKWTAIDFGISLTVHLFLVPSNICDVFLAGFAPPFCRLAILLTRCEQMRTHFFTRKLPDAEEGLVPAGNVFRERNHTEEGGDGTASLSQMHQPKARNLRGHQI